MANFPLRYPRCLIETLALVGGLDEGDANTPDKATEISAKVSELLNTQAQSEDESGWQGTTDGKGGYKFIQIVRGVEDHHHLSQVLVNSGEARSLAKNIKKIAKIYEQPATVNRKDEAVIINSPSGLFETVLTFGKRRLTIQRYKGLGEMNPDQLWETTLDPEARTLLQVKVSQADTADEIFTKLMGDVVEARREFIQENALKVANLDV